MSELEKTYATIVSELEAAAAHLANVRLQEERGCALKLVFEKSNGQIAMYDWPLSKEDEDTLFGLDNIRLSGVDVDHMNNQETIKIGGDSIYVENVDEELVGEQS